MRTHRIILLILAVGFLSFSLSPQAAGVADASTASEMGALSIVVGSVVLVAAPLSMSVNTVTASASKANIVEVQATDAQGRAHVLDLPKATADKAISRQVTNSSPLPKQMAPC